MSEEKRKKLDGNSGIRIMGRIDFLIEQIGFISVPKQYSRCISRGLSLECFEAVNESTYQQLIDEDIDLLRDFSISDDLGLVVAFNTNLITFKQSSQFNSRLSQCSTSNSQQANSNIVQLQRGDIVAFDLVPGYGYGCINVPHPDYPLCCER